MTWIHIDDKINCSFNRHPFCFSNSFLEVLSELVFTLIQHTDYNYIYVAAVIDEKIVYAYPYAV